MGILDKIKNVGRALTGGGAKLYIESDPATVDAPFKVRVKAVVADASLKIDAVYVLVRAQEEVRLDGSRLERSIREHISDFTADGRLDGIIDRETTCDIRVNISGPEELAAGQEYNWEGEVTLPSGSMRSYRGRNCVHQWRLQAGLDAFGNDPDSGWVDLQVG